MSIGAFIILTLFKVFISIARGLFSTIEAIKAPCSVKAMGKPL
jgi:hypothetical protein